MQNRLALVVDDEPEMRAYVDTILNIEGFHTLQARNGTEAFLLVQSLDGLLDLIVTDVRMPGGDGVALAYAVAASYPDIRLILTSGWSDPSVLVAAEFLQKPFVPVELMEAVRRVCAQTVRVHSERFH